MTDVALYHNDNGRQAEFALQRNFLGGCARISTLEELQSILRYCERMLVADSIHMGRWDLMDRDVILTLSPVSLLLLAPRANHHQDWQMESVTSSLVTSRHVTSRTHVNEGAEQAGHGDKPPIYTSFCSFLSSWLSQCYAPPSTTRKLFRTLVLLP